MDLGKGEDLSEPIVRHIRHVVDGRLTCSHCSQGVLANRSDIV